jgi:hypothetical protein
MDKLRANLILHQGVFLRKGFLKQRAVFLPRNGLPCHFLRRQCSIYFGYHPGFGDRSMDQLPNE